jgi:hypothetical protein
MSNASSTPPATQGTIPGTDAAPPETPTLATLVEDVSQRTDLAPEAWIFEASSRQPLGTVLLAPLDSLLQRLDGWRPPTGAPALAVDLKCRDKGGRFCGPAYRHTLRPREAPAVDPAAELRAALQEERAARLAAEERAAASKPLEGRSITTADPFETARMTLQVAEHLAARMHPPAAVSGGVSPEQLSAMVAAAVKAQLPASPAAEVDDGMAGVVITKALEVGERISERLFARWQRQDEADAAAREASAALERVRAEAEARRAIEREKNTLTVLEGGGTADKAGE